MIDAPTPDRLRRWPPRFLPALEVAWRDKGVATALSSRVLRARYKRSFLGVAWALLSPLAYTAVFIVVFDRIANVDTRGIPYPVFVYSAMVPWGFFTASFNDGSQSILNNGSLVNRLSVSRMVFPLSSMMVAFADMLIAALLLPVIMMIFGASFHATSIWVVVVFVVQAVLVAGIVLVFASLAPYLRDIRHVLPLLSQMLLLITPVAYGFWSITSTYRTIVSFLNPLAPIIDAYRQVLLLGHHPEWSTFGPAVMSTTVIFVAGVLIFDRLEKGFADVA